jgi:hypothetical protein
MNSKILIPLRIQGKPRSASKLIWASPVHTRAVLTIPMMQILSQVTSVTNHRAEVLIEYIATTHPPLPSSSSCHMAGSLYGYPKMLFANMDRLLHFLSVNKNSCEKGGDAKIEVGVSMLLEQSLQAANAETMAKNLSQTGVEQ